MPGQVVLALQGGGALGAYQVGVYQAMHEAGVEPDWVIGTSIGAINGAIIAGNEPRYRMDRLRQFWHRMEQNALGFSFMPRALANAVTMGQGIPAFFEPNLASWWNPDAKVGIEQASFYQTAPLRTTLDTLVDFDYINDRHTRLTVGAVNARTGDMRYFDSRKEALGASHVMASGALPPAFPAVRIDGEPYWDGGIFSNTPIEAVLDDEPRRSSVIFSVQVWNPDGSEPQSMLQVLDKHKEIQYASRASNIEQQRKLHRLRHVIRQLTLHLSDEAAMSPEVRELASWGCGTTMHVVSLKAPRVGGEDHTKDIDFSAAGIRARWQAGYEDTQRMIALRPWDREIDPIEGIAIHELP
ncbi:patatin-like phospholipase family protein [Duganella sp. BJB488]|uniref:patatin-like phospholipase family protein n=1 Tax=unclassified Duganella TaxID=2636909 RepID=UPI000E34729B|nr:MULTISPECIES: patatin-like phospholipase family protein [unclassified Duganella]NVD71191.1 patatin-like phospholipase family protein [Duganella sp. BJB1802]RFP09050.1 patatin-like phospholipase family protein [Duganella sp. BJB489]RFP11840.1 patatin-like phospholipase family protein [Duganella sp. BJB488]RFP29031.1 patatin-like phospholipase family protein [Duganella sp. BJB480]